MWATACCGFACGFGLRLRAVSGPPLPVPPSVGGGGEGVEALRAATLARIPHRRRRRQQQQVALVHPQETVQQQQQAVQQQQQQSGSSNSRIRSSTGKPAVTKFSCVCS